MTRRVSKSKKDQEREQLLHEYLQMFAFAICAEYALIHIQDMAEYDEMLEDKCILDNKLLEEVNTAIETCHHIMDANPFPETADKEDSDFVNNLLARVTESTLIATLKEDYEQKYGREPECYSDKWKESE